MVETLEIDGSVVEFDSAATRRLYAVKKPGKADDCRCDTCRNFVQLRNRDLYTAETHALFARLGIDVAKEDEILGTAHDGGAYYQVPFDFVGRVLSAPPHADSDLSRESRHFADGPNYPWGEFDAEAAGVGPIANVVINISLPWVLDEPPGGSGGSAFIAYSRPGGVSSAKVPRFILLGVAYLRWFFGGRRRARQRSDQFDRERKRS